MPALPREGLDRRRPPVTSRFPLCNGAIRGHSAAAHDRGCTMLAPTPPVPPPARVVAAAVYAAGRRIAETSVAEAGTWARKPGHVVWIGLYEPSDALLHQVQA